ncbi:MAG: hypothetical protein ACJA1F_001986 [Paracoccaceae bacterium]|jgi:hypothetical protein
MGGETRLIWKPDMERMSRVIIKNARGHAFFECGEPKMDDPKSVWAHPIALISAEQREAFEGWSDRRAQTLWPEAGSKMMTHALTGQDMDGDRVIVQDGVYRYSVVDDGGIQVRTVPFDYLATEVRWDF